MLLQHQTWQEVETYLTRSPGIILPIGSTEQHGPNGLIGTDAICAEVIARGVGEATAKAVVASIVAAGGKAEAIRADSANAQAAVAGHEASSAPSIEPNRVTSAPFCHRPGPHPRALRNRYPDTDKVR